MNLFQFAVDRATQDLAQATPAEREELARDVAINDELREKMLRLTQRFWEEGRFSALEVIAIRKTLGVYTRRGGAVYVARGPDGYRLGATLEEKAAVLVLIEEMALSALLLRKVSAQ